MNKISLFFFAVMMCGNFCVQAGKNRHQDANNFEHGGDYDNARVKPQNKKEDREENRSGHVPRNKDYKPFTRSK